MPTCPSCFTKYPSDTSTCSADGTALVPDETFAHVDRDVGPGTTIGEYRIESKLGQGGFGAVYRAVHPLIGKMAAVKVLSRQFSSNPEMVSRFIAEARAVNQIRNRNIIDIFSFGQLPDGRQYYIMELLEGVTFDAYLKQRKRLSFAEALPILRGIARALDAAHGKGILHRDLKPENVFLVIDEDGRIEPKLLDFGLVKLLASPSSQHKTKTGTPMGTPYYMSPEQCRGLDVDARTDVYSFGALVFEVLTGHVPFEGASAMDVLLQHMTAAPPSASNRCPEVEVALDAPLARILAKEPADRPARVGEALELLARALGIGASGIGPFSPPQLARETVPEHVSSTMIVSDPAIMKTELGGLGTSSAPAFSTPATSSPKMQTFLGSETDVAIASGGRSRAFALLGGLGVAALLGAGVLFFTLNGGKKPERTVTATTTTTQTATASATQTASAPVPVAVRDEVDVHVDGAPDGTVVSANGVELGKAPGPFKLKAGAPAKLTFVAKGYKTKELTITPSENVLLPVSLDKAVVAAGGGKHPAPTASGGTIHSDLEGFDNKK